MKVTVCFDDIRVVVPCGDGQPTIADLAEQAIRRYKKVSANLKSSDRRSIRIQHLKSQDGGILDPDDLLAEVVDDKEQIIAVYVEVDENEDRPSRSPISFLDRHDLHNGADGTSAASSVGTSSPDILPSMTNNVKYLYQGERIADNAHDPPFLLTGLERSAPSAASIASVKSDQLNVPQRLNDSGSASSLFIGRESSDAVKIMTTITSPEVDDRKIYRLKMDSDHVYGKKSTEPVDDDDDDDDDEMLDPRTSKRIDGNGQENTGSAFSDEAFKAFTRSSARKSLNSNVAMLNWLEAQERLQDNCEMERVEPVGSSDEAETAESLELTSYSSLILMENEGYPLGIHVVPCFDDLGRNLGLTILDVEITGRVYKDGRLRVGDRIIEINGTSVLDVEFNTAQAIFLQAMKTPVIKLRVVYSSASSTSSKLSHFTSNSSRAETCLKPREQRSSSPDELHTGNQSSIKSKPPVSKKPTTIISAATTATTTTTRTTTSNEREIESKKVCTIPAVPARNPNTVLTGSTVKPKFSATANTRIIGHKITVTLLKGSDGLGFSVTTRDNVAGDDSPIYIKNILPRGAAVKDGRLQPGDRLLQVNEIEMSGKSQEDVVAILRGIQVNESVTMIVSRHLVPDDTVQEFPSQPPEVKTDEQSLSVSGAVAEKTDISHINDVPLMSKSSDLIITLNISMVDPLSRGGIGISVKGKTAVIETGNRDMGLFVKDISKEGAAARDGRLRIDDRLLEVNSESLLGHSNATAMTILRRAILRFGPKPRAVNLVISRRRPPPPAKSKDGVFATAADSNKSKPESQSVNIKTDTSEDDVSGKQPNKEASILEAKKLKDDVVTQSVETRGVPTRSRFSRNTSYQQATYDSLFSDSIIVTSLMLTDKNRESGSGDGESVLVEEEENDDDELFGKKDSAPTECTTPSSGDDSQWDSNTRDFTLDTSITEEDPKTVFDREAFGRQSMSEKRKGHMDPKILNFYQHRRGMKEGSLKRTASATSLATADAWSAGNKAQIMSSAAMKRCSSLESVLSCVPEMEPSSSRSSLYQQPLQHPQQSQQWQQRHQHHSHLQSAVTQASKNRSTRWNESFRAAIDKSYNETTAIFTNNSGNTRGRVVSSQHQPLSNANHLTPQLKMQPATSAAQGQLSAQRQETSRGLAMNDSERGSDVKRSSSMEKRDKGLLRSIGGMFGLVKTKKDDEKINFQGVKGTSENQRQNTLSDVTNLPPSGARRKSETSTSNKDRETTDRLNRESGKTVGPQADGRVAAGSVLNQVQSDSAHFDCNQQTRTSQKRSNEQYKGASQRNGYASGYDLRSACEKIYDSDHGELNRRTKLRQVDQRPRYTDLRDASRESSRDSSRDRRPDLQRDVPGMPTVYQSSSGDVQSLERRTRNHTEQHNVLYSSDRGYAYNPSNQSKQVLCPSNSVSSHLSKAQLLSSVHNSPAFSTSCNNNCQSTQASSVSQFGSYSNGSAQNGDWCYSCSSGSLQPHLPVTKDLLPALPRRLSKSSGSSGSSNGHSPQSSLTRVPVLPRCYEGAVGGDSGSGSTMSSLNGNMSSCAPPSSSNVTTMTNEKTAQSLSATQPSLGSNMIPRGTPTSWLNERAAYGTEKTGRPAVPPDYAVAVHSSSGNSAIGFAAVGYAMNGSNRRLQPTGSDSDSSSSRHYRPIKPYNLDSGSESTGSNGSRQTDDRLRPTRSYVSRAAEV